MKEPDMPMLPRPIPILMCALMLPMVASAAETCKLGYPEVDKVTVRWQGPCQDGYAHGKGIIEARKDGEVSMLYEGMVERGMPNGKGYMTLKSGTEYSGEFQNGRVHGKAVSVSQFGDRYTGEWENFKRSGKGSIVYTLGGRYDGEWKDNDFHGQGVALYSSGRRVEGEFVAGRPVGAPPRPTPAAPSGKHSLKEEVPHVGSNIPRTIADGSAIPFDASYDALTEEQRHLVRGWYRMLDDSDEPPYPLRGTGNIFRAIQKLNAKNPAEGVLSMVVMVDSEGNAETANIHLSPNPDIAKLAGFVAMKEKYKPARCSGKPCSMAFPYTMSFRTNLN
ncbi:MORN repeat-containing protein [Massilia scottii]|uniref:MORN repeat-containing protein n=1 Tax=Massilia scottii TaxID=3057166 RepID=UPI0027965A92|nr:hypothetical protein [Massilia sp. CCM 9029]MDQ1830934.1 hypothetical protein [Massilia sp. CCM 9029]